MERQGYVDHRTHRYGRDDVGRPVDDHRFQIPARNTGVSHRTPKDIRSQVGSHRWQYEKMSVSTSIPHDNVRDWLAHTLSDDADPRIFDLNCTRDKASFNLGLPGTSRRPVFESFLQVGTSGPKEKQGSKGRECRKRLLKSSSESSFLEPATRLVAGDEEDGNGRGGTSSEDHHVSKPVNVHKEENFGRRKRHKMREDPLESRKALMGPDVQAKVEQSRERKAVKSSTRRKGINRTGGNLMHNFSSKMVGRDRLTIQPSKSLGVFKNGRASSPGRKRGLPDLVFAEMEFLQHSKQRYASAEDQRQPSKHQGKENRSGQRAQNGISDYFKSSITPVAEDRVRRKFHEQIHDYASTRGQALPREGFFSCNCRPSYPPSYLRSPHSSNVHSSYSINDRGWASQEIRSPLGRISEVARTTNRIRDFHKQGIKNIVVSTNPRHSGVSGNIKSTKSRSSTTPEPIRYALDQSGIFDYTGINRAFGRVHAYGNKSAIEPLPDVQSGSLSAHPTIRLPLGNLSKILSPGSANSQQSIELQDAIARFRRLNRGFDGQRRKCKEDKERDSQPSALPIEHRGAEGVLEVDVCQEEINECLGTPPRLETIDQIIPREMIALGIYVKQEKPQIKKVQMTAKTNAIAPPAVESRPEGTAGQRRFNCSKDDGTMTEGANERPALSAAATTHDVLLIKPYEPESDGNDHVECDDALTVSNTSTASLLAEYETSKSQPPFDDLTSELPNGETLRRESSKNLEPLVPLSIAPTCLPSRGPSRTQTVTTAPQRFTPLTAPVIKPLYNYQLAQQRSKDFSGSNFDFNLLDDVFEVQDGYLEEVPMDQNEFSSADWKESAEGTEHLENPDPGFGDMLESSISAPEGKEHFIQKAYDKPGISNYLVAPENLQGAGNYPHTSREEHMSTLNAHMQYSSHYGRDKAPGWLVPGQEEELVMDETDWTGFWRPYRRY